MRRTEKSINKNKQKKNCVFTRLNYDVTLEEKNKNYDRMKIKELKNSTEKPLYKCCWLAREQSNNNNRVEIKENLAGLFKCIHTRFKMQTTKPT